MRDAIRVFEALSVTALIIALIRWLNLNLLHFKNLEISMSIIVIFYLNALFFMISFRIFVKYFYLVLFKNDTQVINTLIIGAGQLGILTKNTLVNGGSTNYRVLGFIDDNIGKVGKTIEGIPVYHLDDISALFVEKKRIKEIVFAINNIATDSKRRFIDTLVNIDVTIKIVPPVERWIQGELNVSQIAPIKIEDLLQREPIKLDNPEVMEFVMGKSVMVTGAAGSIGSELVRQLLLFEPSKIVMVDQAETPMFELRNEVLKLLKDNNIDLVFKIADVSNKVRMEYIFRRHRPRVVFHAAAYKHVPLMEENPFEAVRVNVLGTKLIADLSFDFGVERFVMISTDKAVKPTNVMGATKKLAELYCQYLGKLSNNSATTFVTTRFGNVLGSNGSVIKIFRDQIDAGGPITVTHPEIIRYFMTIPEACQLVLEASAMGAGSDLFIFDMGQPVKIVDLARKMIELAGLKAGEDIKIVFSGLRPGEKLYEELLLASESTLPTHHSKIMIAQVEGVSGDSIITTLQNLDEALKQADNLMIVAELKKIIPDFISNNSEFEQLDKKQLQDAHVN
jgi:FlaA1/EpsC-like NDP-sugar epimerase